MIKPATLRAALCAAVPYLQQHPETLHLFIDEGRVRSTFAGGLSCEYSYVLNVLITDYAGPFDALTIPVINWLRDQQPDMIQNPERMRDGFTFEVDVLSHEKCDVSIKLKLTENCIVRLSVIDPPPELPPGVSGPALDAKIDHPAESPVDPLGYIEHWTLFFAGQKIGEWDSRPFDAPY